MDEKLDALVAWLRKQDLRPGAPDVCAQVALSFYERRDKSARWFGAREERLCWEQWRIPLEVFAGDDQAAKEREQRSLELQDVLRGAVQHALGLVNEKRDHIPPVVSADVVEVAPAYDHAEITALAGATVAYELINLFASKRR